MNLIINSIPARFLTVRECHGNILNFVSDIIYYLLLAVAMRDCHAMFPAAHVEEFISKQGGDMPAVRR